MESSDEDDKFLYGSDNEDPNVTSQKLKKPNEIEKSTSKVEEGKDDDDDDDNMGNEDVESDNNDVMDEDEDDEYNVEFVISVGPDTSRLDSRSKNILGGQATGGAAPGETISVVPTDTTDQTTNLTDGDNVLGETKQKETLDENGKPINIEAGSIDLDKDGLFDGRLITEIDPEVLKEKPWRQPGANLSDYFNFGFNESTWTEYLHRQERLRDEYSPRRILMGLLTLQQQGKLDIKTNFDPNANNIKTNINNHNKSVINPTINKPPVINTPPPGMPQGFPAMPMFGGFPPFGMPGMMPMNPQPNMNNNNNNNSNNNNNNNQRSQQR